MAGMADESRDIRVSDAPGRARPTSEVVPVGAKPDADADGDEQDPTRRPTNRSGPPSKVRERSERHTPVVETRRPLEELGIWVQSPASDGGSTGASEVVDAPRRQW